MLSWELQSDSTSFQLANDTANTKEGFNAYQSCFIYNHLRIEYNWYHNLSQYYPIYDM